MTYMNKRSTSKPFCRACPIWRFGTSYLTARIDERVGKIVTLSCAAAAYTWRKKKVKFHHPQPEIRECAHARTAPDGHDTSRRHRARGLRPSSSVRPCRRPRGSAPYRTRVPNLRAARIQGTHGYKVQWLIRLEIWTWGRVQIRYEKNSAIIPEMCSKDPFNFAKN